ncbi:hypothetical protein [Sphaerisporangium sp. TRM90804]|uniref:hypothetical protein n=1 Tax=Sphaerisporangium sp. TRM90804 TaxID=3031113 RepID=UPI0024470632|nr:hypothetical protein [Sphaerisporangium sp. TRM90804]MDH2424710.1 hypothetical protein [Sphaerisporangium sp. TRM90804]
MILLAILTGMIVALMWTRQTKWYELLLLGGWGLLAATTDLGAIPAGWLAGINNLIAGWFS